MTEYEQQLKTMREAPSKLRDLASTCEYHEIRLTALTTTQMREIGTAIEWSTGCIDNLQSQVNAQVAANQVLLSQNQSLRSHIVEWKPGGFNGTELPEDLASGTPILAHAYLDEHFVAVKFGRDDTGYWFTPLPGVHCDIEWEDIDYWIPLSSIPLPQPPVTE